MLDRCGTRKSALSELSHAAGSDLRKPKTHAVWSQDESGRVHTPFEPLVLAATLALLPVLIIEADTISDGWLTFAERTEDGECADHDVPRL